jgi:hypothetical protein
MSAWCHKGRSAIAGAWHLLSRRIRRGNISVARGLSSMDRLHRPSFAFQDLGRSKVGLRNERGRQLRRLFLFGGICWRLSDAEIGTASPIGRTLPFWTEARSGMPVRVLGSDVPDAEHDNRRKQEAQNIPPSKSNRPHRPLRITGELGQPDS